MRRGFRRKRRVDMQTFRLCENEIELVPGFPRDCNDPIVHLVKVLDAGQEVDRARRSVLFAGGHLRVRLNTAIIDHDDCPCSHSVHVVLALVKLPLLEDTLTPAYLPNLAITRTFNSVVAATNADNDEDILWWHDEQLDVTNLACTVGGADCLNNQIGTNCPTADDAISGSVGALVAAHTGALYGRMTVDKRIAVRRRIREREALFLYLAYFSNVGTFNDCPTWPFRLNAYLRYAVR